MAGSRTFWSGVVAGVVLLFALRAVVNHTALADWLVSPLLVADTVGPADAIVVPGAGIVGPCSANVHGVRRVLRAARLWKEGLAPYILISGGTGEPGCPVAVAMSRLAEEIDVPAHALRTEPVSRSTHENASYSARLLQGWGARRILLVTDHMHMPRASRVFEREGFDVLRASVPVYETHPDNVTMLYAAAREAAALAYYRLRGWLAPNAPTGQTTRLPDDGRAAIGQTTLAQPDGPIVLLGASYAGGWNLPAIGDIEVLNRGVGGQQSFELRERFATDVVAARPRAVLLWGFINDIFRSTPDAADEAVARIREAYLAMLDMAEAEGIEPVVITEITAGTRNGPTDRLAAWIGGLRGKPAYQDAINRHVVATNDWLVGEARRRGLLVLDFQSVLADAAHMRRAVFTNADGSHVSAEGYALLSAFAGPILQEHFRVR